MNAGDLRVVFGNWPCHEWDDLDGNLIMDLPNFYTFAREVLS